MTQYYTAIFNLNYDDDITQDHWNTIRNDFKDVIKEYGGLLEVYYDDYGFNATTSDYLTKSDLKKIVDELLLHFWSSTITMTIFDFEGDITDYNDILAEGPIEYFRFSLI